MSGLSMRSLWLFLTMCFLTSCGQDKVTPVEDFKLSAEEMTFSAEGGNQELNIRTSMDVKAVSDAPWCTVTEVNLDSKVMKRFTVAVSAIDGTASRTADITLTIGSQKEVVKVVQKGVAIIVNKTSYEIPHEAGDVELEVDASVDYDVDVDVDWLTLKSKDGSGLVMVAQENIYTMDRKAVVEINAAGDAYLISVVQKAAPGLAPDKTGMESDAKTLMKKMTLGINLGNTLEATGGETAWGAPKTTEAMIKYFKELGFNAVRVPCSWDQNLESGDGYVVRSAWMDRVKEVIDYIVGNDMYAILNIHWDGGWLENDIPNGYNEDVDAQQRAIWTQIAAQFRDYDEHLVFAGTNEPNVNDADDMATLLRYEQTFIDAVRATGGRNAYRVLVFQGPNTDVDMTVKLMNTLPTDTVEGRLAAEVHYYTPWNFCGMTQDESWGKMHYFWGNDQKDYATGAYAGRWGSNNEDYVANQMAKMKTKFWDNGIPVIIGEYSVCSTRNCNLGTAEENARAEEGYAKSRAAFNGCVVKESKANGCVPFYWHCQGDLIDRNALKVTEQATYEAIVEAGRTQYPD